MSTLKVGTIQDHANSNTAMTIDNGGRILTPSRPMFDVAKINTQTTTSGQIEKVTWDTVNYDIGSNFASNKFTAPVAGKYFMNALVTFYQMAAGAGIGLQWYKNGSVFRSGHHQAAEVNITFAVTSCGVFDLAASDELEVWVFQGSGSDQNIGVANNSYAVDAAGSNYWSGYLIG
tara:strand:+ start:440 stop:964 length:525 start_codon:yes stop_codon:yes gene_type:complete